jgi:hypothetical protein
MNDHEHDERVFKLGFQAARLQILTHLKHEQERYPTDAGSHGRRMIEWIEKLAPVGEAGPGPLPPLCNERCESDWIQGDVRCSLTAGHAWEHVFSRRVAP